MIEKIGFLFLSASYAADLLAD